MHAIGFSNWFPPIALGSTFLAIACLKFYGLHRRIEGGAGTPFARRLCGT